MPAIACSAPGKIILSGEHAVVYEKPAIAIPVFEVSTRCTIVARPQSPTDDVLIVAPNIGLKCNLRCLVEDHPIRIAVRLVLDHLNCDHLPPCEIGIHSSIPPAAGMGSSASTSVALIRALTTFLGHPFEDDLVNQFAFELEKRHHGTPSGIDNTVVTYAKPLFFTKGKPVEFLPVNHPVSILIVDSGIKGSTSKAVAQVRSEYEKNPLQYNRYFDDIADLTLRIREGLLDGDLQAVGKAMSANHTLLKQIGVSCQKLDDLVECALQNGAWGAKLSGSGLGGNLVVLADPVLTHHLESLLRAAGAVNAITAHLAAKGQTQCRD